MTFDITGRPRPSRSCTSTRRHAWMIAHTHETCADLCVSVSVCRCGRAGGAHEARAHHVSHGAGPARCVVLPCAPAQWREGLAGQIWRLLGHWLVMMLYTVQWCTTYVCLRAGGGADLEEVLGHGQGAVHRYAVVCMRSPLFRSPVEAFLEQLFRAHFSSATFRALSNFQTRTTSAANSRPPRTRSRSRCSST